MDAKDLPDLEHVKDVITEANAAKDALLEVSPNAINPDADDVAPTDDSPTEADEPA